MPLLPIYGFHQPPQDPHLPGTHVMHGILPYLPHAEGAGLQGIAVHLLHTVVPVGVPHGPLEYGPVGIAAHIPFPPIGLGQVVKSLQNQLIGGLTVHRRLGRIHGQIPIHIPPVVLTKVGFHIQPVVVPCPQGVLVIPPVAGLEHVEVQPGLFVEPQGGRRAPEGMIADELVRGQLLQQSAFLAV